MSKRKWQIYREKLKASGKSMADLARSTEIYYPRITGFFNGYWDLRPDEISKVDACLKEKNN